MNRNSKNITQLLPYSFIHMAIASAGYVSYVAVVSVHAYFLLSFLHLVSVT